MRFSKSKKKASTRVVCFSAAQTGRKTHAVISNGLRRKKKDKCNRSTHSYPNHGNTKPKSKSYFKNCFDDLVVGQMYPKNVDYLLESYNDATKRPYGYLLLDLHQLTPQDIRLQTNILPNERHIFTLCETHK